MLGMDKFINGWMSQSRGEYSKYLTLLAQKNLNVILDPSYKENRIKNMLFKEIENFNKNFNDWNEYFNKMYNETQKRLNELCIAGKLNCLNDSIKLKRRICKWPNKEECNATEEGDLNIGRLINSGEQQICINIDLLSSWALRPVRRYGVVILEKNIDFRDIIYFNYESCDVTITTSSLLESDEFIVVNRDPKGLVSFKKNDITIDPDYNGNLDQILYKR
jgi:hypothetical protein